MKSIMNRNKKMWLLPVVFCMLLAFLVTYGCGKKEKAKGEKGKEAGEVSQKVKQEKVIKIGAILPLTGNIAFIGKNFSNGLKLALEESKAQHMQVIYEDSKAQPKTAVNVVNRLLIDPATKIIVTNLSSVTNAIVPVILNANNSPILIASLTSKSNLTTQSPLIFRYFLSSQDEVKKMIDYFNKINVNQIGVLYLNDEFGKDAFELFKRLYMGDIVFEDTFSNTDKDFRNLTVKIKKLDNLYIIGYGPVYGLLVKQLRESGYKGKIFAFSSINSPVVLKVAGETADGIIFTGTTFDPVNTSNKKVEIFVQAYERMYNKIPDHYAAYGYDVGTILSIVDKRDLFNSKDIVSALLSLKNFDGLFGRTLIDNTGDFHFDVHLYKIVSGRRLEVYLKNREVDL